MPQATSLQGRHVAILAEDLYEDLELWYPLLRLREAGAEAVVVVPGPGRTHTSKHGYPVEVDRLAGEVDVTDFDAVIIPEATPRTACAAIPPWWPWCGRRP